ncbi:EVE domain-containing protein [Undibacterium sp. Di24W]|uniref:EVE domain-containing protein n=1 Tax=Undibacterium sp. Di24W TaxID=3413033 RepID=UPI003BF0487F
MKNWIAVASAEHVAIGRELGFMQVCHGKVGPLRRLRAGDKVVYYSPTQSFGGKEKLQSFTACGTVLERAPYQVEMYADFHPFRCDVNWDQAQYASILPLLPRLEFSRDNKNWGYQFRFGLFEISAADMTLIQRAMLVEAPYDVFEIQQQQLWFS